MNLVRLQKYLAETGLGSRRGCESIILAGRVTLNGSVIRQLGTKIQPGKDRVAVDGSIVRPKRKLHIALNKPTGVLCSRRIQGSAPQRRVYDLLPDEWSHLFTVGRLDVDSEGLILLTNDGDFAHSVGHPRCGARKVYHVTVAGRLSPSLLPQLIRGVVDRGQKLSAVDARLLPASPGRSVLELVLIEGKNREIRRLLHAFNLKILHLQRSQIGPVRLGQLPLGKWRTLTEPEINSLLASL